MFPLVYLLFAVFAVFNIACFIVGGGGLFEKGAPSFYDCSDGVVLWRAGVCAMDNGGCERLYLI